MFLGHYAVAFAAKRAAPATSLGTLFLASVFIDLLWPLLLLAGVERARIEMTDAGRSRVRDGFYTGGVDAHAARGWTVRDSVIEGFWCADVLAEHTVHL